MLALWQQWRNQVDFSINQLMRWQRGGFRERPEDKAAFFSEFDFLQSTETRLLAHYPHLHDVKTRATLVRYLMNLNRALVCEQLLTLAGTNVDALAGTSDAPCTMLEVGIKDGDRLDGLWAVCRERLVQENDGLRLTGIECDMWRITDGFFSRWDKAQHYSKHLPHATVLAGDAGQHKGQYAIIWFFLPFVFPETADAWGLPRSLYNPTQLFEHLTTHCLKDGGLLFVTNQTDAEAEVLQALFTQSSLLSKTLMHMGSHELSQPFSTHHPQFVHHGHVWQKTNP